MERQSMTTRSHVSICGDFILLLFLLLLKIENKPPTYLLFIIYSTSLIPPFALPALFKISTTVLLRYSSYKFGCQL